MKYVGIHTQQASNNMKSLLLLLLFPCILLGVVYVFLVIVNMLGISDPAYGETSEVNWAYVNYEMMHVLPWVVGIVGLWFLIAYFMNTSMVRRATGARPLERRENPRVYNIVENLTMACGMPMPKVNVIDDPMLNAFAVGDEYHAVLHIANDGMPQGDFEYGTLDHVINFHIIAHLEGMREDDEQPTHDVGQRLL